MLKRKAYGHLEDWKKSRTVQGLLIGGARQVGKTTLVREFAREHYENVAEVNFHENKSAVETIGKAADSRDLFLRISALSRTEIVPGKTLVFLDEIQECSDVLTWVKFLGDRRCDFILSGSMLGLDSFPARSLPVGFLNSFTMYPLDFEEFCWASGIGEALCREVRDLVAARKEVPDYLDEIMLDAFYKYLLVGGFPDAVQSYVSTDNLASVRNVHEGIFDLYSSDISKYVRDRTEARQIRMVYESIPGQLNSRNKRFKYTRLGKNLRFANLETAFDWLEHAGVALSASRVGEPVFPLGLSADENMIKLYMNDTGLLTSRLMGDVDIEILNRRSAVNFGSIFENVAAQEFFKQGYNLHYYDAKGTGEIDFVLQTRQGRIVLCEIKSGKDYRRHSALNNLLETKNYDLHDAFVFCEGDVKVSGNISYLPVYAMGFLKSLC